MTELLGIARFRFHEGQRDEWLRLSEQAAELVRANEPGTLQYDIFLNADQSEAMVIERYRDSEAAMQHAENVGPLFGAVFATVDLIHGELLGDLSPELSARLEGSEAPVVFTPYRRHRP
jgi:quinol monooxygenase YgiN